MRVLLMVLLLIFSFSAFGQRKKIEFKYEIRNGKESNRKLGLNFYGDTINRIPLKFLSLKNLQAFREYEFDSIPERCKWNNSYTVMLRINQKSKRIPYLKAQGELPDNPEDAGVRISTHARVFGSCALVYTDMTLLGNEYAKRIASNVKIFDSIGNLVHEVTATTETMFDHVEIDEDAKFMSCVTYTGPNDYGDIKGGTIERSSTVSIYSLPNIDLIKVRKLINWKIDLGKFYDNYLYWMEKSDESQGQIGFCVFNKATNEIFRIFFNEYEWYVDSILTKGEDNSNRDGIILRNVVSKENSVKYFERDFEKLK